MTTPPASVDKLALVIGIDVYRSKGLEDLPSCKKDAMDMHELLSNLGYAIFGSQPILGSELKEEYAWVKVHTAIRDFFKNSRPDQTLLFYFSGHGIQREDEIFLGMPEVDPKDPIVEGYSLSFLTKLMNSSKSMKIVSVIDACYSGAASLPESRTKAKAAQETAGRALATYDRVLDNIPKSEGRCFLLSSQAYQPSLAMKDSNSLYTKYLIEALRGAESRLDDKGRRFPASVDDDGNVTPESLHKYVYYRVANEVEQVPKIKFDRASEIILAEHPKLAKRSTTLKSGTTSEIFYSKMNRGDRYYKDKHYPRALSCYDEAIAIDPSNHLPFIGKGDVFFGMGKNEDAIKAYEGAIAINPEDPEAYDLLGDVYFRLMDYKKALENYDRALKIDPESSEYLKDKGLALYGLKDYEKAITWFDEAIARDPNNTTFQKYKGDALFAVQRYEETIVCIEKVLGLEPKDIDALNKKGLALISMKRPGLAADSFQKVLQIDPTFIQARENLEMAKSQITHSGQVKRQTEKKIEEKSSARQAIVVGINKYEDDGIQTLYGAENDAIEISKKLQDNGNFTIPYTHYLLGRDATKKNILRAFSEIFRKNSNYDLVTIYFSGQSIVDKYNIGYLAPYDMESEDPFVSGIRIDELETVIINSQNPTNVIILLDCCNAEIATSEEMRPRPVYSTKIDYSTRNLISSQFSKMMDFSQDSDRGVVIFVSSEANAASKERINCTHSEKDQPHIHGSLTYHLLEGIDGKAADPDTGVIYIPGLVKYVTDKMAGENKQSPVFYANGASRIDSIKVAISQNRFVATVEKLVSVAQGMLAVKYPNSNLIDFQYLTIAAKKIGDLASLDPNNEELPRLRKIIGDGTASYSQPTIEWLTKNSEYARPMLNSIEHNLYDFRLPEMVQNLSYDNLQKMDMSTLKFLTTFLAEVARNTEFQSDDDKSLNRFYYQLRAAYRYRDSKDTK